MSRGDNMSVMNSTETIVKPLVAPQPNIIKGSLIKAVIIVAIVVAGMFSGWGISRLNRGGSLAVGGQKIKSPESLTQAGVKVGDIIGATDERPFKDPTEGVLVEGGIDGEGSHHLLKPGGKSQNVYLTSSVVDLSLLVGHKVKVWGETFSAQKAGWLMDVGRVQILELNSPLPFEE